MQILFIIVVNELYRNFCISVAVEHIAVVFELLLELLVVLDDSIMNTDNL